MKMATWIDQLTDKDLEVEIRLYDRVITGLEKTRGFEVDEEFSRLVGIRKQLLEARSTR